MRHPRRLFLLLPLLLIAEPARAAQSAPSHVVVARLVNWPREQHVPHCGIVHWVVLMEYELVRIEQGEPIGPHFWVAVSCPELARGKGSTAVRSLKVGDLHRLELTEKYPSTIPRPRPQPGVTDYFWPLNTNVATP